MSTGRAQSSQEGECIECGEEFGVHDLEILKPLFKAHACKVCDFNPENIYNIPSMRQSVEEDRR